MTGYQLFSDPTRRGRDCGEAWPDDTKRPLTSRGVSRVRKSARGLVRLGVSLDVILTSPLVRARQTSDLVASAFDPKPPIVVVDALAPGGSIASVLTEVEKQMRRSNLAPVGHEPDIGEMAAHLSGLRHRLEFKKGGACHIDMDSLTPQARGTLQWFLTPGIMRRLRQ